MCSCFFFVFYAPRERKHFVIAYTLCARLIVVFVFMFADMTKSVLDYKNTSSCSSPSKTDIHKSSERYARYTIHLCNLVVG